MGTFKFGSYEESKKGCFVNFEENEEILEKITKSKYKRFFDSVHQVIVADYNSLKDVVVLEIWCKNIFDILYKKPRYNVFYITYEWYENMSCFTDTKKY